MASNGPTFTKATYDAKRPRRDPPSPAKAQVAREQMALQCAITREFNKLSPKDKLRRLGLIK